MFIHLGLERQFPKCCGDIEVIAVCPRSYSRMVPEHLDAESLVQRFAQLDQAAAEKVCKGGLRIFHHIVKPGEAVYLPPAFISACSGDGGHVSGVRYSVLPFSAPRRPHHSRANLSSGRGHESYGQSTEAVVVLDLAMSGSYSCLGSLDGQSGNCEAVTCLSHGNKEILLQRCHVPSKFRVSRMSCIHNNGSCAVSAFSLKGLRDTSSKSC